jgi:hypothetical protein
MAGMNVARLARALMFGALGEPLQAHRLLMGQRPDKHLRGRIATSTVEMHPNSARVASLVQRFLKGH